MTGLQNLSSPAMPAPPLLRIHEQGPLLLAGLRRHIDGLPAQVIPSFWQGFAPYVGWIPGQVDKTRYGALLPAAGETQGFDYLTAVKVANFGNLNADWATLEVPLQRYAIFPHRDHVSELRQTLHTIFAHGLPALNLSPRKRVPGMPILIERYDESFDLRTGWGDIEVWVPLNR